MFSLDAKEKAFTSRFSSNHVGGWWCNIPIMKNHGWWGEETHSIRGVYSLPPWCRIERAVAHSFHAWSGGHCWMGQVKELLLSSNWMPLRVSGIMVRPSAATRSDNVIAYKYTLQLFSVWRSFWSVLQWNEVIHNHYVIFLCTAVVYSLLTFIINLTHDMHCQSEVSHEWSINLAYLENFKLKNDMLDPIESCRLIIDIRIRFALCLEHVDDL